MVASIIVLTIALVAVLALFVPYIVYSYKAYKRLYDKHISLIEENDRILKHSRETIELADKVRAKNEELVGLVRKHLVSNGTGKE